jgi:hypothetical protein
MVRRSDLYAQIDEAARADDGNRVRALVDQLGPTTRETRVLALLHQVPGETAEVLGQVTLAESAAWGMAQAASRGPVGLDFAQRSVAIGGDYAEALALLHEVGERFIHATDTFETVGDVLHRVRARESAARASTAGASTAADES